LPEKQVPAVAGDELQTESGVSASEFSKTLTMMEISGIIRALGGNQWTLRQV